MDLNTALNLLTTAMAALRAGSAELGERGYKGLVRQAVMDAVWGSNLDSSSKLSILERLERGDPLVARLYACSVQAEFAQVLRLMGLADENLDKEQVTRLIGRLEDYRFENGSSHQQKIIRDMVRRGLAEADSSYERILAGIDSIPGRISSQPLADLGLEGLPRTVERIDPDVGSIAVLASGLDFPLLTQWSPRLENAFSPYKSLEHHRSMGRAYERLVEISLSSRRRETLGEELEEAVVLCVEGDFPMALDRLNGLMGQTPRLKPHQLVILHRLIGTIHLSFGEGVLARSSYKRAQELLAVEHSGPSRNRLATKWLDRQLRLDALNLGSWRDTPGDVLDRQRLEMQGVPAWHSHPAIDHAMRSVSLLLAQEAAGAATANESTLRLGSRFQEATIHFKRALVLAYLTGDYGAAKNIRLHYAEALTPLLTSHTPPELLAATIQELIRAENYRMVKRLLAMYGHLVSSHIDWDEFVVRRRATDPISSSVDDYNLTTLTVIEHMAPYLKDSTLDQLNKEFVRRAVEFAKGIPDGLVRGYSYHETFFIEAFEKIVDPGPIDLEALMEVIVGQESFSPFSFWQVLPHHNWEPEDIVAARRLLQSVPRKTGLGDPLNSHLVAKVLVRLGEVFEEVKPFTQDWMVEQSKSEPETYFPYLLNSYEPRIASSVREFLDGFVHDWARQLRGTRNDDGSISFREPIWPIRIVPIAVRQYPHEVPSEARWNFAKALLEASASPDSLASMKTSVIRAVGELLPMLDEAHRSRAKLALKSRDPLDERAKLFRMHGPKFSPTHAQVQIALLTLRLELGIPPSVDHEELVLDVLANYSSFSDTESALVAAEVLMNQGISPDNYFRAMYQNLNLSTRPTEVVALVARSTVRTAKYLSHSLPSAFLGRLDEVVATAQPFVAQSVFHEAFWSWQSLNPMLQEHLIELARRHEGTDNRNTRFWAGRLLSRA